MDAHRFIQLTTIAGRFTGVITHATMNRGEGIVLHNFAPRFFVFSFFCFIQPPLNILPGWAPLIAGRQMVNVDRAPGAPIAGMIR
jgi:hypothetical protein